MLWPEAGKSADTKTALQKSAIYMGNQMCLDNVGKSDKGNGRDVQRVSLDITNWGSAPINPLFNSSFFFFK